MGKLLPAASVQVHVEHSFAAMEPMAPPQAGDFILVHGMDRYAGLIGLEQSWRFSGSARTFAYWTHAAMFVDATTLQEAQPSGMRRVPLLYYHPHSYAVVRLDVAQADRAQMLAFADAHARDRYDWLTVLGVGLHLATGGTLRMGLDGAEICSGFIARALERAGYDFPDAPSATPADLGRLFGVLGL